jgi:hypothetical protein
MGLIITIILIECPDSDLNIPEKIPHNVREVVFLYERRTKRVDELAWYKYRCYLNAGMSKKALA